MSWTVLIRKNRRACPDSEDVNSGAILVDVEAITVGAAVLEMRFADGEIFGVPLAEIADYTLTPVPEPPQPPEVHIPTTVDELELTCRPYNALKNAGLDAIEVLVQSTAAELLTLKNFGPGALRELKLELSRHGLALAGPVK